MIKIQRKKKWRIDHVTRGVTKKGSEWYPGPFAYKEPEVIGTTMCSFNKNKKYKKFNLKLNDRLKAIILLCVDILKLFLYKISGVTSSEGLPPRINLTHL